MLSDCAWVVGVKDAKLFVDGVNVDSVHSWIRGGGRVSAEARSGSGASKVVKTSCWSARRARGEAQGLMEEAGKGKAHMAPSFVGLPWPRTRAATNMPGKAKNGYGEVLGGLHACADRVKCICLTRAPAAVGVLMAFGLSDVCSARWSTCRAGEPHQHCIA